MNRFLKKSLLFFFLYSCFLLFTQVATWIIPDIPTILLPRFYLMALWAVPLIILINLKNIYSKIVCFIWVGWFIAGSINVIASYFYYGNYYLVDVEFAHLVYIVFITTLFLAIFIFEKLAPFTTQNVLTHTTGLRNQIMPEYDTHPVFSFFLIVFPFIWFLSLYSYVGYIPILQGINIEKDMYALDFGPFYGFMGINILSMLLIFGKFQKSISIKKYWYLILLVLVAFFSISNGKRMTMMIFFLALLCYILKTKGNGILKKPTLIIGLMLTIVFYCGMMLLRQGYNIGEYKSAKNQLTIVGVEFRDFVYAVNKFDPNQLKNYNWAASALVSGVNSEILEIVGIDKQKIIEMSFGYVSKPHFSGGFFGVRTGIISELYFAYHFYGLFIIFIFGLIIGWIGRRIHRSESESSLLFLSAIYGLLLITLVSQTIDIIGTLTVLFYAWIIFIFIKVLYPLKYDIHNYPGS